MWKLVVFSLEGLPVLMRFQFLLSLHPWVLVWVRGWKKQYSKQYPSSYQHSPFFKMLSLKKPWSLGSIFTCLFSSTENFTHFGKRHLSSSFVADHEDIKVSTCFCFHYERFPTICTWPSKSGRCGWIHALESSWT